MKKFLNDPADVVRDALTGFIAAHADLVRLHRNPAFVQRAGGTPAGKVAIVSGGGSGHEPLHIGFVGPGMLDAACPGAVFTSPTPDQILAAMDASDAGAGVLLLVKNYDGDVMNFEMAAELATVPCRSVVIDDDAAGGRGVAGTVVVEKLVGAFAETGADLAACEALAVRANRATRSLGVALSSCTVPEVGEPSFAIGVGEMEEGVGIHGERGRRRAAMKPAREITRDMVGTLLASLPQGDDEVLLMTNGFASTPLIELYLMHGLAQEHLERAGLRVTRSLVGNVCTSLDMAGCSFTVTRLDDELRRLWDAPVRTPALAR